MMSDHNLVSMSEEWRVREKIKELTLRKSYIKF